MRRLKRVVAVVATLALSIGMTANCFAANWKSYFGVNEAWFEGAEGKVTSQSATGWTAEMDAIGYGGCWGGQVSQSVDIENGQEYNIKFTLSSSNCDKWVFVKIAKKDDFAYGKWIKLKKGKKTTVEETFKATANADTITFGIGGEFGDRKGIDKDAKKRYAYASGGAESLKDDDPTVPTVIKCSDYSLEKVGATSTESTQSSDEKTEKSTTVATGDFEPIAYGMVAVLAAAVVVVFAKKREA